MNKQYPTADFGENQSLKVFYFSGAGALDINRPRVAGGG